MTHPLDLDELAVVDRMHSTCLASGAMGNLLLVGVELNIDMQEWDPCGDQTSAVADIDLMGMSCLGGVKGKKNILLKSFFSLFRCFVVCDRR